eukprot:5788982-Alexandrium_andersonii.AAC.1
MDRAVLRERAESVNVDGKVRLLAEVRTRASNPKLKPEHWTFRTLKELLATTSVEHRWAPKVLEGAALIQGRVMAKLSSL